MVEIPTTNATSGRRCSQRKSLCRFVFLAALFVLQLTLWWTGGGAVVSIFTGMEESLKQAFDAPRTTQRFEPKPYKKQNSSDVILRRIPENMDECFQKYNAFSFPESKDDGCHVNEGGRPHCQFQNLRLYPSKISSHKPGGEPLESVMGQSGEGEFLTYESGAFSLSSSSTFHHQQHPEGKHFHYLTEVLKSIERHSSSEQECSSVWKGTTLFLTRYEYVNVYHTMTDWWNTFFSIPAKDTNVLDLPINMVFLDAHPQGNLDVVWNDLLLGGNVTYARHLNEQTICFETARFVPPGYGSPLFPLNGNDKCPSDVQGTDFSNFFLSVYDLLHVRRIPGHIVVIERVPYVAHPRSDPSKALRIISNIREYALTLPAHFVGKYKNTKNVTVEVVTLVDQEMREQIRSIRQADILIANHGAGMTHELFMDDESHVIELTCDHHFFVWLAKWRPGIRHHCRGPVDDKITAEYWQRNVLTIMDEIFSARET